VDPVRSANAEVVLVPGRALGDGVEREVELAQQQLARLADLQ